VTRPRFSVAARRARDGVTLIELVVVCVIVTIVTAVTIPIFARIDSAATARSRPTRIQDLLTRCREIAVGRGVHVRTVVDSATSAAWIGIRSKNGIEWQGPIGIDTSLVLASERFVFSCAPAGAVQGPELFVRDGRELRQVVVDPIAGRLTAR
jgi:prepilin-type N-terminal cleavage/methylation domain-containing protein